MSLLLAADLVQYDVFSGCGACWTWRGDGMKCLGEEGEVLEKLKLAIFGVQAKSDPQQLFSFSKKSNQLSVDSIMVSKSR
eukprot:scaffold16982_cov91-Skeletonema_dohrnii-CCMP3373.AAC.10